MVAVPLAWPWLLVIASFLWGITNPAIRQAGLHPFNFKTSRFRVFREIGSLLPSFIEGHIATLFNLYFIIPFLINLVGSAAFFLCLRDANPAVASVVGNALTLIITAIAARLFFGEGSGSLRSLLVASLFIGSGSLICMVSELPVEQ